MTGAAIQTAQGRLRLDDHISLLDQNPEGVIVKSPFCAPPDGLTLFQVNY